ncbi:MAG TPA: hypothetical protein VGD29_09990 [Actinoplanes sp.]
MTSAVLDEALKKAALAWVSVGDGPALGLWCMPLDGSLIVVTGPGEQFAPDLPGAQRATVRLRGDNGGLIVVAEMTVARILPGSDDWDATAPQLATKRLNAHGSADRVVTRWVEAGCTVLRLSPVEDATVTAPDLPSESAGAEPRDTPARVEVRRPFRLHKVRRR